MSLSYKELRPVEKGVVMTTLPPASGMVVAVAFSLVVWACIASLFIIW